MRYIYIYIFLYLFNNVNSQTRFNVEATLGIDSLMDIGVNVIESKNGFYISCGVANSPSSTYRGAYLVKTNATGNLLWKKQYNFSIQGVDAFTDLKELPDSNYLLLGTTYDSTIQNSDVFLAKIDTGGNLIWFKKYTHTDNDQSRSLKLTPDGKVIIVGNSTPNPTTTYNDALLIKTDLNGNLIWRKRFGNTYDEVYYSIDIIKNNTEYLLGGRYGYYNTGNPFYDFSVMRTDTAGNVIWQQQYGTAADESGGGAVYTLDSGVAICGTYNNDGALLKLDKNGVQQWLKNYGLPTDSYIRQVKQLKDSTYVMIFSNTYTPTNSFTGFLIKADKNGNQLWKRVYPGPINIPNYFFGFNTTADGGFIMTGQYNHIGQPYQNMWLVKTDSLGCDSVSCSYLVTGVAEQSLLSDDFVVYPNPSNSFINVECLIFNDNPEIKIISMLGEIIYQAKVTSKLSQIDVSQFTNGVYFIEIKANNFIHCKKFIKQ